MAIRFVDVEAGKADEVDAAKPAPARRARAPEPPPERDSGEASERARESEPVRDDGLPGSAPDAGEAPLPGLPHAKPDPKPRGRKKPMAAVGADRQAEKSGRANASPSSAPLLEGLLPEPLAHAKPTPKPRGRKKAFG